MNKQVASKVETIVKKLGFADAATIEQATKDSAVVAIDAKFPRIRKALSRVYGHAVHNVPTKAGRRATWHVGNKGSLVAKSTGRGLVKVTWSTTPAI